MTRIKRANRGFQVAQVQRILWSFGDTRHGSRFLTFDTQPIPSKVSNFGGTNHMNSKLKLATNNHLPGLSDDVLPYNVAPNTLDTKGGHVPLANIIFLQLLGATLRRPAILRYINIPVSIVPCCTCLWIPNWCMTKCTDLMRIRTAPLTHPPPKEGLVDPRVKLNLG